MPVDNRHHLFASHSSADREATPGRCHLRKFISEIELLVARKLGLVQRKVPCTLPAPCPIRTGIKANWIASARMGRIHPEGNRSYCVRSTKTSNWIPKLQRRSVLNSIACDCLPKRTSIHVVINQSPQPLPGRA